MGTVQLLLGVPRSGKTTRCLDEYARELHSPPEPAPLGRCLWLVPAREARNVVMERLLARTGGVVFQPNVLTFNRFADRVLEETGHDGRSIPGSARRLILRRLIQQLHQQGELQHFGRIAATDGFLDVVVGFIAELKRAEIWPDAFLAACRARFGAVSLRDTELGRIYQKYQDVLLERKWYDAEGRYWLARTALQNSRTGFWKELSLVVVDGFSDFTQTQQEILEQLAVGSRRMIVTLPIESPGRRPELFAKPASVLRQLLKTFQDKGSVEQTICEPDDAKRPAGLRQIRQQLFANPRDLPRASAAAGLEIISATGDRREKIAVALRIKRLLAKGDSPNDVVIGLRSVAVSGQAWREFLASAGIPVWCEAPAPWSRSPYLKALSSVLRLEAEDWPFERLNAILNSTAFHPQSRRINWTPNVSPRRITDWLRQLKLHSGRAAILKGLARRQERVVIDDAPAAREDLAFAVAVLRELSSVLEPMRKPLDLEKWSDVLAALTSRLGLAAASDADRFDADWLQRLLRAAAAVEAELSDEPIPRSLPEFLELLRDFAQNEPPPSADEPHGRIRIVGAETLRHLEPKHLFLVEMTEDTFPSRRADDCLYSETERLKLHQGGLALSHRELHQREEMLLFYQAVTRAGERVTLSYSNVNPQGHEVYPSPFVTAIAELFAPPVVPERVERLDPMPRTEELLTATDLRLAAVAEARRKSPGWWKRLLEEPATQATARNVLAAAEVAVQRFLTPGFTPFEGRLTHPRNLADLARRFGPERQFSPTELERYAACPFRFWLTNVLELESLASPDVATDHAHRGTLIHDVLALLADEIHGDSSALVQRFRELVAERLARHVTENELQRALLRIEQELLDRWAEAFGRQHADFSVRVAQTELTVVQTLKEVPFGQARDARPAEPQQHFPALEVGTGESAVRLGGRIDRIDVAERHGQTVFTLIDYKSGREPRFSLQTIQMGESLQLALYAVAVMRLNIAGPDALPLWMGYWSLKETGFRPCGGKKRGDWTPLDQAVLQELDAALAQIVPQLVARIRGGEFVVDSLDADCTGHCEFHTICRVNQIRPLADRLNKHRPPLPDSRTDDE